MSKVIPIDPKGEKKEIRKNAQVFPAIIISFVDVQNGPHAFVLNATRARDLALAIQAALAENGLLQTEPS